MVHAKERYLERSKSVLKKLDTLPNCFSQEKLTRENVTVSKRIWLLSFHDDFLTETILISICGVKVHVYDGIKIESVPNIWLFWKYILPRSTKLRSKWTRFTSESYNGCFIVCQSYRNFLFSSIYENQKLSKENNKNIFKHEHFWTTFSILFLVLTSFILKLDCTYHTFDHATSRDTISRHLNLMKVQNYYSNKSAKLLLKWR